MTSVNFGSSSYNYNYDMPQTPEIDKTNNYVNVIAKLGDKLQEENNDEFIRSDKIKTPAKIVTSIALMLGKSFVAGAGLALLLQRCSSGKVTEIFESSLKSVSKGLQKATNKLANNESGIFNKSKDILSGATTKANEVGTAIYKRLAATSGKEGVTHDAAQAFRNFAGFVSGASTIPSMFVKDTDKDGIADILEKNTKEASQRNTSKCQKIGEFVGLANELLSAYNG